MHKLTYTHPLGQNPLMADLFNRGPFAIGGDNTTIWATVTNLFDLNCKNVVGPPYRMIVDLGQLENSVSQLSPGQSGNPASEHYDDQVENWFTGEYHPMQINQAKVEQTKKHQLTLMPFGSSKGYNEL